MGEVEDAAKVENGIRRRSELSRRSFRGRRWER